MPRRLLPPLLVALLLAGCGYHLVGQRGNAGDQGVNAIPDDVATLSVVGVGERAEPLAAALRERLLRRETDFALADRPEGGTDASHAVLRVERVSEQFRPVAYDSTGVASQYRLTLSGRLSLRRAGAEIWRSGVIRVDGDVFATADPLSIEAMRERLGRDLEQEWLREAWLTLSSGF